MKRYINRLLIFCFVFLLLLPLYKPFSYNSESLSYISHISITKSRDDLDTSSKITTDSLPFTMVIYLVDKSIHNFDDMYTLLLFSGSFSSKDGEQYFVYDDFKNAFILTNMTYDGVTNAMSFAISNGDDFYHPETIVITQAVVVTPDDDDDESSSSDDDDDESSNSSSSSSSSSKDKSSSSSKTSEGSSKSTTSSSTAVKIPADLKPNIILFSHKIKYTDEGNLNFDLSLEFFNTSKSITVENIMINFVPEKFDSKARNLYLNNSNSSTYIESIPPQGKTSYTLSCSLDKDLDISVFLLNITIDFQYIDQEDKDPISSTNKSTLTINPNLKSNLRIDDIHPPDNIMINKNFELEYRLANIEVSSVSNVDILITDDIGKKVGTMFIGKMSPNSIVNKPNIKLNIKKAGQFLLNFNVSYLDDKNIKQSISRTFVITVNDEEVLQSEQTGMDMEKNPTIIIEKSKFALDSNILIGFLATTVVFITVYAIYRLLNRDVNKEIEQLSENLRVNNLKSNSSLQNDIDANIENIYTKKAEKTLRKNKINKI